MILSTVPTLCLLFSTCFTIAAGHSSFVDDSKSNFLSNDELLLKIELLEKRVATLEFKGVVFRKSVGLAII